MEKPSRDDKISLSPAIFKQLCESRIITLRVKKHGSLLLLVVLLIVSVAACDQSGGGDGSPQVTSTRDISGNDDSSSGVRAELEETTSQADKTVLQLYFTDEAGLKLVKESRVVTFTPEPAKATIEALLAGPSRPNGPTIPPGTRLNSIRIEKRVAFVDFSRELIDNHPGGSAGERHTVYSIVNSLTEWPAVDAVRILVDGTGRETIAGHTDISGLLESDEPAY